MEEVITLAPDNPLYLSGSMVAQKNPNVFKVLIIYPGGALSSTYKLLTLSV